MTVTPSCVCDVAIQNEHVFTLSKLSAPLHHGVAAAIGRLGARMVMGPFAVTVIVANCIDQEVSLRCCERLFVWFLHIVPFGAEDDKTRVAHLDCDPSIRSDCFTFG